jgi:hypothetical protein
MRPPDRVRVGRHAAAPLARWSRGFALALLGVLPLATFAAERAPLEPFTLHYEVLRNGKPLGEATLSLNHVEGETWEFLSHTRGTHGLASLAGAEIIERSEFRWLAGRPELLQYRFSQEVAFKRKQRAMTRSGARIDSVDGQRTHDLPFEAGVMDRNSVVLAIGADLARGAPDAMRYRVANREAVEWQRYRRVGREQVDTPAGRFDAIRVERVREKPGRSTTTWVAASLGHVPVRSVHREADGEIIEMRLLRQP